MKPKLKSIEGPALEDQQSIEYNQHFLHKMPTN